MFTSILAAVDVTGAQHPELQQAVQLAQAAGGRLHLVDVVKDLSWLARLMEGEQAGLVQQATEQRQKQLDQLIEDCRQQGVPASGCLLTGTSSEQIVAEARRVQADLVVRSAKGQHSLSPHRLGTTAQRLLRSPPCAVWLHGAQRQPIQSMIATVDAAPHDAEHAALNVKILRAAKQLAEWTAAQLTVVYAWTLYGDRQLKNHLPDSQYQALLEFTQKEHADAFNQLLRQHQIPADSGQLLAGDASQAVPRYCARYPCDLLICGTMARTGIPGLWFGNTIERIVQQVDCSILALPPV